MKKIPKILSMMLVVGLIAAIPASTQILADAATENSAGTADASNLPLLILVNRLELSQEQTIALRGILSNLIGERGKSEKLAADFEQTMISFTGTTEELDALLATFREDQQALAGTLRESIASSLDEVRDLLSINQGRVLQETLPQLMGGVLLGTNQEIGARLQRAAQMSGAGVSSRPMTRGTMADQQSQRALLMGSRMQDVADMARSDESSGDEVVAEGLQARVGTRMAGRTVEDMETMMVQRLGQIADDGSVAAMREQMRTRLEQTGSGSMGNSSAPRSQMGMGLMDQRSEGARATLTMQGQHGNLFEVLERVVDVLDLKREAME
ncbi:hypothetical protein KKG90_12175 [Candidatus Bipolaricaulota bacterium]|nr:hypothetical protein [Candidatus Bipolaricaulota bacterium]